MNLMFKIRSVASNPAMMIAYSRWIGAKLFFGKPPKLTLTGARARIGGWLSFSEYWSFQHIVPEPERLFMERCLTSKGARVAFDIGANLGVFTCLMAELGIEVHAFEPIPETFYRLKNNVKFNRLLDRCRLNCLAVGRERDLVTFYVQEASAATNRMAMPGEKRGDEALSTQVVAVIDLDGYCKSQGIEFIDFLKIDVEGMEPYVLQGANRLLRERKIAAVLIEICPANLYAVGLSPADLFREFETARYSPYVLSDNGKIGAKFSLAEIEVMPLANVVLLPDV